jgi:hypothetical protein
MMSYTPLWQRAARGDFLSLTAFGNFNKSASIPFFKGGNEAGAAIAFFAGMDIEAQRTIQNFISFSAGRNKKC